MNILTRAALPFALSALLGLTSCFVVPKEPEKIDFPEIRGGEISYRVEEVKRQDLINSLSVFGSFQPVLKERLFFKYSGGRLLELFVEEEDEVSEGAVLARLNVSGLENQLRLQEIALEKAQIVLEILKMSGSNRYEHRLAELDVLAAEIRLEDSFERLDNSRIVAPFSGVVTFIKADIGDFINPFDPIISLENIDRLKLECDPKMAQHLVLGMTVDVEFRRETYQGTVIRSYRDIIALGYDALEEEKVEIEVSNLPVDTERDETARVTVVTGEARNAIVIHKTLVRRFDERTFVHLLKNGIKVEQDIVTGLETRSKVEIVEGLSEGDQLILR